MEQNDGLKEKTKEAYDLIVNANEKIMKTWLEDVIWTWEWWLLLALATAPWILFILFRKKESTSRLLFVGFFVILITSWFDFLGILLGRWYYVHELVPFIPAFIPWDFSLFPITIMFMVQFKPQMSVFIKAILYSSITSFLVEPIFKWLGMYQPMNWKYIYSFPIMVVIYLIAHFLSTRKTFTSI